MMQAPFPARLASVRRRNGPDMPPAEEKRVQCRHGRTAEASATTDHPTAGVFGQNRSPAGARAPSNLPRTRPGPWRFSVNRTSLDMEEAQMEARGFPRTLRRPPHSPVSAFLDSRPGAGTTAQSGGTRSI
jgi:hypothetical protein